MFNVLDLALACSEMGSVDPTLPITLYEELVDVLNIPDTEHLLEYLESRVDRLVVVTPTHVRVWIQVKERELYF